MIRVHKFLFLFLTGTLIMLNFSCGEKETLPEVIRPVRYVEVFASGGSRVRTFSGVAQAGVESNLSFKVGGTIQKILVKLGDKVRPGQLIAQLDPADYLLQVEQADAALAQAQAQARNADAAYDRAIQLYENRNISKSDLDAARAAAESAKAAVNAMEKQLELAKRQLSYTKLTAPVSGAIAVLDAEINENVRAGQKIVSLTSGSNIEVKINLPEVLITQIREGDEVSVRFDAISGREFKASITEVGIAAVDMSATYPVTLRLNDIDPEIRPGMAASVNINFETSGEKEHFLVPSMAVQEDRRGRFVYIVNPMQDEKGIGIIERRPVEVGDLTGDGLEVLSGIRDGDKVVTAGVSRITEGQKVRF